MVYVCFPLDIVVDADFFAYIEVESSNRNFKIFSYIYVSLTDIFSRICIVDYYGFTALKCFFTDLHALFFCF